MSEKKTTRDKSVLTNIPVQDNAFPLMPGNNHLNTVVGGCPTCGAPIYGKKYVPSSSSAQRPEIIYTCHCNFKKRQDFASVVETK